MRAVTVAEPGGPEVLGWGEVPDPVCGPGEVIVDVAATAVNRADLHAAAGLLPAAARAPATSSGWSAAASISEVGEGVTGWTVGDEVCALLSGGGYAERVAVPAGQLLPVPAGRRAGRRRPRCPRSPAPSGPTSSCSPALRAATPSSCTAAPAASARWPSSWPPAPAPGSSSRPGTPGQARRLPRARRRAWRSTTATRTSSSGCATRPTAPASTSSSTTWARSTWPATSTPWPWAAGWSSSACRAASRRSSTSAS